MKKPFRIAFPLLCCIAVFFSFFALSPETALPGRAFAKADVLIIDPGHGGIDGGAVSASGICEKEINLAIAQKVQKLAEADGWEVILTREDDRLLSDNTEGSIRSQKTEDLHTRKDMIDSTAPLLAVSIHLNSFKEDTTVRGAQTFFSNGNASEEILTESKRLAEAIQECLEEGIADEKERTAMGKKDVLLLKEPTVPTVIVECGFLSNSEEARLLQSEEYQQKLAECIYRGILQYTGRTPAPPVRVLV
ncbi:MAG: N-acetylmuramoyl-L-alanine amidase [Firmicutes bacterium]|nr:N-acetylmuramoyl-L-alanine amidase [Bacillota bacterium]